MLPGEQPHTIPETSVGHFDIGEIKSDYNYIRMRMPNMPEIAIHDWLCNKHTLRRGTLKAILKTK